METRCKEVPQIKGRADSCNRWAPGAQPRGRVDGPRMLSHFTPHFCSNHLPAMDGQPCCMRGSPGWRNKQMLYFYLQHHVGPEYVSLGIEISVITSCSIIHPSWGQRPHWVRFNPANNERGPASAQLCNGLHILCHPLPAVYTLTWQPVMLNGSRQLVNINLYLSPNLCPKLYLLSLFFFPTSTWVTKNHLQPNLDLPNHWLAPSSNLLPVWILPNTAQVILSSLKSPQGTLNYQ